uniref:Uncharacterized protein n=1 Tax=Cannabis sativa TaxID=3483 RepID=A0A803R6F2_CANSA
MTHIHMPLLPRTLACTMGVMLLLDMEIISNLVLTNSHSSDLCYLRDWRVVVSVSEAFGLVFIWLELLMVCGFCALLS